MFLVFSLDLSGCFCSSCDDAGSSGERVGIAAIRFGILGVHAAVVSIRGESGGGGVSDEFVKCKKKSISAVRGKHDVTGSTQNPAQRLQGPSPS